MRDAADPAMLQEPQGAGDVGGEVIERTIHRGTHASQGRQMDHGVDALVWQAFGADVAAEVDAAVRKPVLGRDQVVADDPVTRIAEMTDDVGADEAGRTGDENAERFEIHAPRRQSTAMHQGNEPHHAPSVPEKTKRALEFPPDFAMRAFMDSFPRRLDSLTSPRMSNKPLQSRPRKTVANCL